MQAYTNRRSVSHQRCGCFDCNLWFVPNFIFSKTLEARRFNYLPRRGTAQRTIDASVPFRDKKMIDHPSHRRCVDDARRCTCVGTVTVRFVCALYEFLNLLALIKALIVQRTKKDYTRKDWCYTFLLYILTSNRDVIQFFFFIYFYRSLIWSCIILSHRLHLAHTNLRFVCA